MKIKKVTKMMILFLIAIIAILIQNNQVEAKYILSKKVEIPITTSDYYFNVTLDKEEINFFPATINVTVKNHDGTNFADKDLIYSISVNEGYTVAIADEKTERTLEGNKKNEETFAVTINKENSTKEDVILTFNVEKPYKETLAKNIKTTSIKVANNPDISKFNKENTYYVTWNTTNSPYAINEETKISEAPPSNWYNYTAGQNRWANIKTTGGGNDCYWVWIPRYAYKVPARSNTAQTIEVKFLQGKTNIPIGETEEITNTTPTPGTWVVHPAFYFDTNNDEVRTADEELTGIWVGKYEASSNSVSEIKLENGRLTGDTNSLKGYGGGANKNLPIRVKPNVTSWRGINVNGIFTVCRNLTTSGNSLQNTTDIDSHLIKNTEWGACAYLSSSKYGKTDVNGNRVRVYNNPYYNNTTNYSPITGLAGTTSTQINNGTVTNLYKYNTVQGIEASTTGNVYGIYDMAGGAWEFTATIWKNGTSNTYRSELWLDTNKKYVDRYISYNSPEKYGDAIYETSISNNSNNGSWDITYSYLVNSSNPILERGGRSSMGSATGIFAYSYTSGEGGYSNSFRPTLIVQ